jgi:hypothetical protein
LILVFLVVPMSAVFLAVGRDLLTFHDCVEWLNGISLP